MRLGVAGYIVPFAFVYNPALLAQGPAGEIVISALTAFLGIGMVAIGLEGFFLLALNWIQRILLFIGGLALLVPSGEFRLIGLCIAVILFLWEWFRVRRSRQRQNIEGLKERGAMVIVPSSAVDTMNLGGIAGITAMADMAEKYSERPSKKEQDE